MADKLSDTDTATVFKFLDDDVLADMTQDARHRTTDDWRENRPDDLEKLDAASEDPEVNWEWTEIELETRQPQVDFGDQLLPYKGASSLGEELSELVDGYAAAYAERTRKRIRELQESTQLGPRAFVALVLSKSNLTYRQAANKMGIEEGTFASKMSREVAAEIQESRNTVRLAERLSDD